MTVAFSDDDEDDAEDDAVTAVVAAGERAASGFVADDGDGVGFVDGIPRRGVEAVEDG